MLGTIAPPTVTPMADSEHPPCPVCRSSDAEQLSRTLSGKQFRCPQCGTRWGISLEDEVLAMIGQSLRARRRPGSHGSGTEG